VLVLAGLAEPAAGGKREDEMPAAAVEWRRLAAWPPSPSLGPDRLAATASTVGAALGGGAAWRLSS